MVDLIPAPFQAYIVLYSLFIIRKSLPSIPFHCNVGQILVKYRIAEEVRIWKIPLAELPPH